MTENEAMELLISSYDNYSKPDEYQIIEALKVLVEATGAPMHMTSLASSYRTAGRVDLALKYYKMAEECGDTWAYICLGDIWHDGESVPQDLKKAFEYYTKAAEAGNHTAEYKLADMYKKGEYVGMDYAKYCEMIESLYPKVTNVDPHLKDDNLEWMVEEAIGDVTIRLAEIRVAEGRNDDVLGLLFDARRILAEVLRYDTEEVCTMERLMADLYRFIDFDPTDFGLFDLFFLFKAPHKVRFRYDGKQYDIEAVREGDDITVLFDGKWYRSVREFFEKAFIGENKIVTLSADLYGWEVLQ